MNGASGMLIGPTVILLSALTVPCSESVSASTLSVASSARWWESSLDTAR